MGGMTHKELGLPHQLLNKKMHYNLPTVDLMETFSQLRSLFPDDTSLCAIDKTPTRASSIGLVSFSYKWRASFDLLL